MSITHPQMAAGVVEATAPTTGTADPTPDGAIVVDGLVLARDRAYEMWDRIWYELQGHEWPRLEVRHCELWCPRCHDTTEVYDLDRAVRWTSVAIACGEDSTHTLTASHAGHGDFEGSLVVCAACEMPVSLPTGHSIEAR